MTSQRIVDLRKGQPVRREAPSRPPQRESERRSPLRTRRRKVRLIIAAVILILCLALAWGTRMLSYHPQLTIQTISVEGAERVPPEVVISYVTTLLDDGRFHFLARRNIFLYPKSALANAVATNFPRIASAHVSRESPLSTNLIVRIEERDPFSRWCAEPEVDMSAACFWMDSNGFVFAEAASEERGANAYVFTKGLTLGGEWPIGETFSPGHIPGILAMLRYLENADFKPTGASIENDQDLFIYLEEGFFIKASYGQDAAQLARNLELILESDALRGKATNLDYIDLRFGNRVYYKMKGEAEVAAE